MNKLSALRLTLSAALLAASASAFAHPGHDHSHWSSPAVHAVFFAALTALVGIGMRSLRKRRQQSRYNQHKNN